jgi:hypothetical protein
MAVNWAKIREFEGFKIEGYIPKDKDNKILGESGVTVGSGIDLGQQTAAGLKKAGVPERIINKLTDYFGKRKDKAEKILEEKPLTLSKDEAELLTERVKEDTLRRAKGWYNRNNKADNDWSDLTDREQTVVTSVMFQYGVGSKKTPTFNKHLINNDWNSLAKELGDFKDDYFSRRMKELSYLTQQSPEQIQEMVGTSVDGEHGPNTAKAIRSFKGELYDRPTVIEKPLPEPELDPNTMAMVPKQTGIAQRALESTANPVAAEEESERFFRTLTQGLENYLKGAQSGSQTPSRSDTESEQVKQEAAPEPEAEQQFSAEEESFINSAVNGFAEETPDKTEPEEDIQFTDGELELIERASGTTEAEEPVYAEPTERDNDNDDRDPIFGIF